MKRLTKDEFVACARKVHGNKYDYAKVKYVNSSTKVLIKCNRCGQYFLQTPSNHAYNGQGCPNCRLIDVREKAKGRAVLKTRRTRYGLGIIDYPLAVKGLKSFIAWNNMLRRCYNEKTRQTFPTYKDCRVCDEWLRFSNFKKWFDDNYIEGYHLDKDILVKGNKVYSPETCCFVPSEINKLLTKADKIRGNTPLGVGMCQNGLFFARISINKKLYILGTFTSKEDAFKVYKKAKEKHLQEVAIKYYAKGLIKENVYIALLNHKIEITD